MPPPHTSVALYEWGKLEKLSKFLKVFYDVTCFFSGTKYPTANLYFPQVFVVDDTLRKVKVDLDSFMKSMATEMMAKFNKYWKGYSLILGIAVILDPRYKIQFVEFCYKRLYGYNSEEMTKVPDMLFSLFDLYVWIFFSSESIFGTSSVSNGARSHVDDMVSKECLDVMKEFDNFESEEFTLLPKRLSYNFASKSAFSVGGRVLDQYRSALKPENVEALISPNLEELTEDISKMEINAIDSTEGSNTVTVGGQS
ncbi:hypothetical protein L3X38_011202 [Prunus dulcis]|uniref:hAT-like transposase RNase-H fold domain-containing protein n=1 Tax=Prunus dulcis TaxID=3755 RepID=A0AAD4ZF68_PRUDU|nr:hypothetical protein L3X38_011202 [Prunus dulcis]